MKKLKEIITTEEFDKRFDNGEDMSDFLEVKEARVNKNLFRVNIDFPKMFLEKLDEEAGKVGVARTSLIKVWLAERLQYL
ncbi:MAG: CopG family transcriptional regulator [bacterium]